MDDLATRWWRDWKILADLVKSEEVRIGFGIFCSSLLEGDAAYDAWIGELCGDPRFELWLHGFTGDGPNGEPGMEFKGTPYAFQKAAFERSREAMLVKHDTILRTYSEHWHGGDATTLRVFNEDPFHRVWMCWEWAHRAEREAAIVEDRRLLGGHMVTMECPDPGNWQPGYVNFDEFTKEYAGHEADPVVILQGHPWSWTDTSAKPDRTGKAMDRWQEFRKIIGFLKQRGARFVTPYDCYRIARGYAQDTTPPTAPTGLGASRTGDGRIRLGWTPSTDAESGVDCYKIYRNGRPVGLSLEAAWTGPAGDPHESFEVAAVDRAENVSARCAPIGSPAQATARPAVDRRGGAGACDRR